MAMRTHVLIWIGIFLSLVCQQADLAERNRIYLASATVALCLVEAFTLRNIVRRIVQVLNEDPQSAFPAELSYHAQASAEQANAGWPVAAAGAPSPSEFVSGQARAETDFGQASGTSAFADFGNGLPAGSSGQQIGSSCVFNG